MLSGRKLVCLPSGPLDGQWQPQVASETLTEMLLALDRTDRCATNLLRADSAIGTDAHTASRPEGGETR